MLFRVLFFFFFLLNVCHCPGKNCCYQHSAGYLHQEQGLRSVNRFAFLGYHDGAALQHYYLSQVDIMCYNLAIHSECSMSSTKCMCAAPTWLHGLAMCPKFFHEFYSIINFHDPSLRATCCTRWFNH